MIRAFVVATIVWTLGLLAATAIGLFFAMQVPGPVATVAAPLVAGAALGLALRRPLGARASIVPLSAIGAAAGFLLGSLAGFAAFRAGAAWLAPWATSIVIGAIAAIAQSFALDAGRARFVVAAAIAFAVSIAPLLAPSVPPIARALALLVPGVIAAMHARRARPLPARV